MPKKHIPEQNVHRKGVTKRDTLISLVLSPNLGLSIFEIGLFCPKLDNDSLLRFVLSVDVVVTTDMGV